MLTYWVEMMNDYAYFGWPTGDQHLAVSQNIKDLPGGLGVDVIEVAFFDDTATAVSAISLPTDAPSLSDYASPFPRTIIRIENNQFGSDFQIEAEITGTNLVSIPEPETVALLSTAGLYLYLHRKRKRS